MPRPKPKGRKHRGSLLEMEGLSIRDYMTLLVGPSTGTFDRGEDYDGDYERIVEIRHDWTKSEIFHSREEFDAFCEEHRDEIEAERNK